MKISYPSQLLLLLKHELREQRHFKCSTMVLIEYQYKYYYIFSSDRDYKPAMGKYTNIYIMYIKYISRS